MYLCKSIRIVNVFSSKIIHYRHIVLTDLNNSEEPYSDKKCNKNELNNICEKSTERITINSCPEEPTTCCMSGCANCVWITYAEELSKIFQDSEERIKKQIIEKITDPSMRAFLMTELKNLKKQ